MKTLENKTILVTGGAGFIGSHVVDRLIDLKAKLIVLDNLANGKRENIEHHKNNENFRFVFGSILEVGLVTSLIKESDIIINMATLGVRHSIKFPIENHKVNAEGTLLLLELSRQQGIERFVNISSSEVYGTAIGVPQDENHPTFPCTVYGSSKLASDAYARAYFRTYKLPTVVVRPFNTYGPRSHYEGDAGELIPKSIVRALNEKPIIIFGDGKQTRDFSYVTDIARGIVDVLFHSDVIGETINIGSNEEHSIEETANIIKEIIGKDKVEIEYQESRPGDVLRLFADTTKARKMINYAPEIEFREGLEKTIEWFKAQNYKEMIKKEAGRNWEMNDH